MKQTPRSDGDALPRMIQPARRVSLLLAIGCLLLAAIVFVLKLDLRVTGIVIDYAGRGTRIHEFLNASKLIFRPITYVCIACYLLFIVPDRRTFYRYAIATAGCVACVHIFKTVLGRARPDMGLGAFHFDGFTLTPGFDSWPSASTASAVLLAVFIARLFPKTSILFYTLAVLTGLSRIAKERHFLSDVLSGAGVALMWIYWADRLIRRIRPPVPSAGQASVGDVQVPCSNEATE